MKAIKLYLISGLMLVFVVFNGSLLWADLHNEKLLSWLRLWQLNDSQVKPRGYLHYLDMDESAAANEASIKALDWASFSAEYHANRASYLLYISYSAQSDQYVLLQQADRHIKQAIHLLPTWPYYQLLRMQRTAKAHLGTCFNIAYLWRQNLRSAGKVLNIHLLYYHFL